MEKNPRPLVSTVIPTYNRPELLRGAIESVFNQTYKNIEIIVVDDHSPTPVEETISSISTSDSQSIQFLRHEQNRGANVARTTGIENATGDLIAFLDDDDRWDSTKIEQQVTEFQRADNTVGVVYTGQKYINDNGEITSIHISKIRGNVTKQILCGKQIAPFSSVMVRSDVIQQAGLPDKRFPCWQDREWYVRLSQYCEFESIPEPLVIRRVGEHDRISDNYVQKRDEAYPLFLEKHQSLAAEYGQICEKKMRSSLISQVGEHALRKKRFQESREYLMKSVILYPFIWKTYLYLLVAISGRIGYRVAKKGKRLYEINIISN